MSLSKNQNVELYIDSFTSEGSGVGRYENMAVFVSGAAAGDKVTAHIIKVKKTYAVARVEKVLKPAKSRIMPPTIKRPVIAIRHSIPYRLTGSLK